MNRAHGKIRALAIAVGLSSISLAFLCEESRAFDPAVHTQLSRQAASSEINPYLDGYLREVLGKQDGTATVLPGGDIQTLVAAGSVAEDEPEWRVLEHFHDPTRSWASAGLSNIGSSSILWQQDAAPILSNSGYSWHAGRTAFYNALTRSDPTARDTTLARTFTILGHQIHLVQDAASPAHTRNDWHIDKFDWLIHQRDGLHKYGEDHATDIRAMGALRPVQSLLQGSSPNGNAPVPIALLIDTTDEPATTYPGTGLDIGIAEYSNANFFSDDTVFADYTYPSANQLQVALGSDPQGDPRKYFYRPLGIDETAPGGGSSGGQSIVIGTPSAFDEFAQIPLTTTYLGFDDTIYAAYANQLFPRAIGYSAKLIEYFFRGKIDMALDPNPSLTHHYLIKNVSSDEDIDGTFQLFYDDAQGNRYAWSFWSTNDYNGHNPLAAGAQMSVPVFNAPINQAVPGFYLLVFKGRIGHEGVSTSDPEFAVAAKFVDLNPCTAFDGQNFAYPPFTDNTFWGQDQSDGDGNIVTRGADGGSVTLSYPSTPYLRPAGNWGSIRDIPLNSQCHTLRIDYDWALAYDLAGRDELPRFTAPCGFFPAISPPSGFVYGGFCGTGATPAQAFGSSSSTQCIATAGVANASGHASTAGDFSDGVIHPIGFGLVSDLEPGAAAAMTISNFRMTFTKQGCDNDSCPLQCSGFSIAIGQCGNGVCEASEDCSTCPQDCGTCPSVCGDASCNGSETCQTCPADCGPCQNSFCCIKFTGCSAVTNCDDCFSDPNADSCNPGDCPTEGICASP